MLGRPYKTDPSQSPPMPGTTAPAASCLSAADLSDDPFILEPTVWRAMTAAEARPIRIVTGVRERTQRVNHASVQVT